MASVFLGTEKHGGHGLNDGIPCKPAFFRAYKRTLILQLMRSFTTAQKIQLKNLAVRQECRIFASRNNT
jgi:hypothetical protein